MRPPWEGEARRADQRDTGAPSARRDGTRVGRCEGVGLCHVGRWEETHTLRGAGKKGRACTVGPHAAIFCPACHGSHVPTHWELPAHAMPWGPAAVPWLPCHGSPRSGARAPVGCWYLLRGPVQPRGWECWCCGDGISTAPRAWRQGSDRGVDGCRQAGMPVNSIVPASNIHRSGVKRAKGL